MFSFRKAICRTFHTGWHGGGAGPQGSWIYIYTHIHTLCHLLRALLSTFYCTGLASCSLIFAWLHSPSVTRIIFDMPLNRPNLYVVKGGTISHPSLTKIPNDRLPYTTSIYILWHIRDYPKYRAMHTACCTMYVYLYINWYYVIFYITCYLLSGVLWWGTQGWHRYLECPGPPQGNWSGRLWFVWNKTLERIRKKTNGSPEPRERNDKRVWIGIFRSFEFTRHSYSYSIWICTYSIWICIS